MLQTFLIYWKLKSVFCGEKVKDDLFLYNNERYSHILKPIFHPIGLFILMRANFIDFDWIQIWIAEKKKRMLCIK